MEEEQKKQKREFYKSPAPTDKDADAKEKKSGMSPKWPLIVLGLMVVIFVAVTAILFLRQDTQQPQTTPEEVVTEETNVPPQVDTTSIENMLSTWLQDMNTQGALFATQQSCTNATDCEVSAAQEDIVSMWALYKKSLNDNTGQEIIDLTQITSADQPWACHFLYDIVRSAEAEEQSLQSLCQAQTTQPTSQVSQQEINAKIQEIMTPTSSTDEAIIFQQENQEEFQSLVEQASTNAINILWNEADPAAALSNFDQALDLYTSEQEEISSQAPLLSLASLDLYKATEEVVYLDFAEYIYNLHFTPSCVTLTNCANFLYLTQQLKSITGGEQYTQYKNTLTQSILETSFDSPQYSSHFDKNAFYTTNDDMTIYPTRENALILGTFSSN